MFPLNSGKQLIERTCGVFDAVPVGVAKPTLVRVGDHGQRNVDQSTVSIALLQVSVTSPLHVASPEFIHAHTLFLPMEIAKTCFYKVKIQSWNHNPRGYREETSAIVLHLAQ